MRVLLLFLLLAAPASGQDHTVRNISLYGVENLPQTNDSPYTYFLRGVHEYVVRCTDRYFPFGPIAWSVADSIVDHDNPDALVGGVYQPESHRIVLRREFAVLTQVVAHELLHASFRGEYPEVAERCVPGVDLRPMLLHMEREGRITLHFDPYRD